MSVIMNILGAFIVIGASSLAGIYYGNLETYRMRDLQEIKKGLSILRSQVDYIRAPLHEAMQHISERLSIPASRIFEMMAELLVHERNSKVAHMWEAAIDQHGGALYLNEEDIDNIKAFGGILADIDSSLQLANIDLLVNYIDGQVSGLSVSRDKNKKLYRSLGLLCGTLIVIIFI